MEHHIRIFSVIFNLFAGSGSFIYLLSLRKRYKVPVLEHLINYSSAFNLFQIVYLVMKYTVVNLKTQGVCSVKWGIFHCFGVLCFGFMIYSVLMSGCSLSTRDFSKIIKYWFFTFAIACLFFGIFNISFVPPPFDYSFYLFLLLFTILFLIMFLIYIFIEGLKSENRQEKRVKILFSGFSFLPYFLLFLLNLYVVFGGVDSGIVVVIGLTLIFFSFNILPFLLLKTFLHRYLDLNYEADPIVEAGRLMDNFGLSPREKEVCILILQGKDNREIEKSLYISYNTVKNHVSTIYRKTGAGNRIQLMNLFNSQNIKPLE